MATLTDSTGKEYTWIDSDTIADDKSSYRIRGWNAPETDKWVEDKDGKPRRITGQQGGSDATDATIRLAESGGYNIVVDSGEKDKYGRPLIDLKNEWGSSLANTMYRTGAAKIDKYTTEDQIKSAQIGAMRREFGKYDEFDKIKAEEMAEKPQIMRGTNVAEQVYGPKPIDENQYATQVLYSIAERQGLDLSNDEDVRTAVKILDSGSYDKRSLPYTDTMFRQGDRTLEGVAYGQRGAAWDVGWDSMVAGLYGFAELSGVGLGNDQLKEWGKRNVDLKKEEILQAPRLRNLDYRDIDDLWSGYDFMMNNMAMSAPYLVTLIGGKLAAPLTLGASVPIAYGSVGMSYSGQIWNDIKGPKGRKEAAWSIVGGTAMSVLDVLGMKGLMKPTSFLTKRGKVELVKALMKSEGVSKAVAKDMVRKASVSAIKESIDGMGNFALAHVAKPSLMKELTKAGLRGGASEGVTEALQESTQYLMSKGLSEGGLEKNFDEDEYKNVLAQSFIAGTSLGTSFGVGAGLIQEGQRQVLINDLKKGDTSKLGTYQKLRNEFQPEKKDDGTAYGIDDIIDENKANVDSDLNLVQPDFKRIEEHKGEAVGVMPTQKIVDEIKKVQDSINAEQQDIDDYNNPDLDKTGVSRIDIQRAIMQAQTRIDAKRKLITNLENEKIKRDDGVKPLSQDQFKEIKRQKNNIKGKSKTPASSKIKELGESREQRVTQERKDASFWGKTVNVAKWLKNKTYKAASVDAFTPYKLRTSKWARKLSSLIGIPLGNIYSGIDVSGYTKILRDSMLQLLQPKRIFQRFKMRDSISNSLAISEMIRAYMLRDKSQPLTGDLLTHQNAIEQTIKDLNITLQGIYDAELEFEMMDNPNFIGKKVDEKSPQWLNFKSFDWKKVRQNREEFLAFMSKNAIGPDGKPYLKSELDVLYNKVSNNENHIARSIVEGNHWKPDEYRQKDGTPLAEHPDFAQFANTDIVHNMIKKIEQDSRYIGYTKYFGRGGQDLDYMFKKMEEEGTLTPEEIEELAHATKNIIDSATGNYNVIESRRLNNFIRKASFFSSLIGLPLSFLASFPEYIMLIYQNPSFKTIKVGIGTAVTEITNMLKKAEQDNRESVSNRGLSVPAENKDPKALDRLAKIGHFDDDAVAATRIGMGETDIAQAWWLKQFFKITLIAPQTTFQRILAASQVTADVSDKLRILNAIPEGAELNQRQLEVRNQLEDIGMDVDAMVALYDRYSESPERFDVLFQENTDDPIVQRDQQFIEKQMQIASWYYTNLRIQAPQSQNRPLIFQDPRFQLFLQFNGFLSTFTSTVIPRLWVDYMKNGSPRMKYNTFALIVLMMAMAGVSQWLKDYIKFGKSTPYLNDFELVQRALMASGLLGTGERVLQAGLPLYKSKDDSILSRVFGESVGGAPFMRNLATAGKAIKHYANEDWERGTRQATKLIPGLAPITPARNVITDTLHNPHDIRIWRS